MLIHVLVYDSGNESEGIHSLEIKDRTYILMFEGSDDAERYSGLLEAQDFPKPTVLKIEREEVEIFCRDSGYESRFIEAGFIPKSEEDRLLLVPPEKNMDVNNWNEGEIIQQDKSDKLEEIKRRLEGLL